MSGLTALHLTSSMVVHIKLLHRSTRKVITSYSMGTVLQSSCMSDEAWDTSSCMQTMSCVRVHVTGFISHSLVQSSISLGTPVIQCPSPQLVVDKRAVELERLLNCFAASKRTTSTMRSSLRLFARYLEPGAPTGLTGLLTHPSPRSTLISVYRTTLEKLEKFPESSLYRQSVEALTKHRLSFVEKIVPAGYQEWETKALKVLAENPDKFSLESDQVPGRRRRPIYIGGKSYLIPETRRQVDVRTEEWEGERPISKLRGLTKEDMAARNAEEEAEQNTASVGLDDEPQLTADQ